MFRPVRTKPPVEPCVSQPWRKSVLARWRESRTPTSSGILLALGFVGVTLTVVTSSLLLQPEFGALVALLLLAVVAAAGRAPAELFIAAGILAIALSSANPFVLSADPSVSVILRVIGALSIAMAGVVHGRIRQPDNVNSRFISVLSLAMTLYILFATIVNGQFGSFVSYFAAVVVLVLCLTAAASWVSPDELRRGLTIALAVIIIGSLAVGLLVPSVALEQGRLRGLAENANGLGCYAFILGALAITAVRDRVVRVVLIAASVTTIVWTGSRNSALALVTVAVIMALLKVRWQWKIPALLATGAAGILIALNATEVTSLLGRLARSGNSREQTFSYSISVVSRAPFTGIGLGNEEVQVASSPMRALVHAGIWGGIAVLVMWIAIFAYGRTGGARGISFAISLIVYSIFEGVLLSPIGPFLLIMICALIAVQRCVQSLPTPDKASSRQPSEGDARNPEADHRPRDRATMGHRPSSVILPKNRQHVEQHADDESTAQDLCGEQGLRVGDVVMGCSGVAEAKRV